MKFCVKDKTLYSYLIKITNFESNDSNRMETFFWFNKSLPEIII